MKFINRQKNLKRSNALFRSRYKMSLIESLLQKWLDKEKQGKFFD